MAFWLIVSAGTLAVVLIIAQRMLAPARPIETADTPDEMTSDMKVYRDQLKELERDVARGTLSKEDAERARLEVSRRLLEADKTAKARTASQDAPKGLTQAVLAICALVIAGGAFGMYAKMGAPGAPDFGRAKRLSMSQEARETRMTQEEAEAQMPAWAGAPPQAPAEYVKLVSDLRAAVANNPNEPQGLNLLAQHEAALGNMLGARKAMGTLLNVKGDAATADDYVRYADLLINAAGGFVSPEAEGALKAGLERDPGNALGRYYTGLMFAQNDRPDLAFRLWRRLLEEGPADAVWYESIRGQIDRLAALAGEDYTAPAAPAAPVTGLAGPSAEDIEAAQDMSQEDRTAMIQSMIEQLSERLATEGGSPEEWARLISVLGVVGETDRAAAIWTEAQSVFADHPEALATVRAAAQQTGIAQ